MSFLMKAMPNWIDAVRAAIQKRHDEINALEQGASAYAVLAKAVDAHRGVADAKVELGPTTISATVTVAPDMELLPMLRSIATEATAGFAKAKLRASSRMPAVSQHGAYWPVLAVTWRLNDKRAVTLSFSMGPKAARDLIVTSEKSTSEFTSYTVTPADGGPFLHGAEETEEIPF